MKINLTNEQREILATYDIEIAEDINDLLLALDAKITEIGFTADFNNLNAVGTKFQKLYDQIFDQN